LVHSGYHYQRYAERSTIHEFNYHFLTEYSPFFNPIENLFSQWKHFTKQSKPQNEEELINAIDRVATNNTIVTDAHYAAYVRKVLNIRILRNIGIFQEK
jgi:hypothetical protein